MSNNPYRIDINEERPLKKGPKNIVAVGLVVIGLVIGLVIGFVLSKGPLINETAFNDDKAAWIIKYMEDHWLYANDYEDLSALMQENAYYGMTYFENDPYTTYLDESDLSEFTTGINNDFVGIGVTYSVLGNYPIIKDVLAHSPALEAGLEDGDIMLAIDGNSTYGLNSDEVKELVLGQEGEKLTLTIKRAGETMELEVARGHVTSTVNGYMIGDIPILNITSFGESTYDECVDFLKDHTDSSKLVIDLRDNSGGYQDAVTKIAGLFLDNEDIVMKAIDKDGQEEISYAQSEVKYDNFEKIVILTNANTASASEVLTLALLEQHPDTISVGLTTYGKGVMQTTYPLSDGSAIKLTSAKWVSSQDKWINEVGIIPDVEVYEADIFNYPYLDLSDKTYELGSNDSAVEVIKAGLNYIGYDISIDNHYDEATLRALEDFYEGDFDGAIDEEVYLDILSSSWSLKDSNYQKDQQLYEALAILGE